MSPGPARVAWLLASLTLACDAAPTPNAAESGTPEARAPSAEAPSAEPPTAPASPDAPADPAAPAADADAPGSDPSQTASDALAKIDQSLDGAALDGVAPSERPAKIAALENQSWAHYKAKEFHEAGEAFALLSRAEPTVWKHPFNTACAATLRGDQDRAQVYLVEAITRGGDQARAKIRKDEDLYPLRREPWFEELLTADASALAAWVIRTPSLELVPYAAGEAPLTASNITAQMLEPSTALTGFSTRLKVELDYVRDPAAGSPPFLLTATCKDGDRHRHFESSVWSETHEPSGHIEKKLFTNGWYQRRALEHCELSIVLAASSRGEVSPNRLVTRVCLRDGAVSEGRCADFKRPIHDELQVVDMFVEVGNDPYSADRPYKLYLYTEFEFGSRPDQDRDIQLRLHCRAGTKAIVEDEHFSVNWSLAMPGETVQSWTTQNFASPPTQCEFEFYRPRGGPKEIASVSRYCWKGDGRPTPCG